MSAFTLSDSSPTGRAAAAESTSYGRLAGRPRARASAPRAVCTLPSVDCRSSCAWLAAVRACSTSAIVASPTRRRSSAASRLACASASVVRWAPSRLRLARYWKYATWICSTTSWMAALCVKPEARSCWRAPSIRPPRPAEVEHQVGQRDAGREHRLLHRRSSLAGDGLEPGRGHVTVDGREPLPALAAVRRGGGLRVGPGEPRCRVVPKADVHDLAEGEPVDPVAQIGRHGGGRGGVGGGHLVDRAGRRRPRHLRRGRRAGHARHTRRAHTPAQKSADGQQQAAETRPGHRLASMLATRRPTAPRSQRPTASPMASTMYA